MHGNKHQMVLRHKGQILLNPLQSTLINITDVAVMPIDIVTVIKHDIMSLSTVKGIINRAEILFIGFIRMLVRTYSIFHIMISNHSIHRDIQHLKTLQEQYPNDTDLLGRASIIDESNGRRVRMAWLAVVVSHKVNGVSELHSNLMVQSLFADFAKIFPGRFTNVTNGAFIICYSRHL